MESRTKLPKHPLSPQLRVRLIELHTHVHATESREKILETLQSFIPFTPKDNSLHTDPCSGAFGQPIQTVGLKISLKTSIKEVLANLSDKLSPETKRRLNNEFTARLDEKFRFYFRLDKQQAILGRFVLANTSDVIQVIIAVQNKNPKSSVDLDQIKNFLAEYGII